MAKNDFAEFFKQRNGIEYPSITESDKKENSDENEDDTEEQMEIEFTKEDLLELINSLDEEEANDLATYIMNELIYGEDEESDEDDEDELDESAVNEVKYFDKTKQKVRQEKHQDIADKKARARQLKKYYKRNKMKIAKKAKRYRRKVKRHPERVVRHKGA